MDAVREAAGKQSRYDVEIGVATLKEEKNLACSAKITPLESLCPSSIRGANVANPF